MYANKESFDCTFTESSSVILQAPLLKFIYSDKATKFCEISTVDLSYVVPVKSMVEISQNFVAFSELYSSFFYLDVYFFEYFKYSILVFQY